VGVWSGPSSPRVPSGAPSRFSETRRLVAEFPNKEVALSPDMKNFKVAKWRLTSSLAVHAQMDSCALESELHALERVPVALYLNRADCTNVLRAHHHYHREHLSTDQLVCSSRRTSAQKSANKPASPILIPYRTLRSRNRASSGHSNLAGTLLASVRAIIQP
jgi:hypothetical protein